MGHNQNVSSNKITCDTLCSCGLDAVGGTTPAFCAVANHLFSPLAQVNRAPEGSQHTAQSQTCQGLETPSQLFTGLSHPGMKQLTIRGCAREFTAE